MGKQPNFTKLYPLFEANSDFSLMEKQYEKLTGAPMPKELRYLLKGSAVAKKAAEHGYVLQVNERTMSFKKLIYRR